MRKGRKKLAAVAVMLATVLTVGLAAAPAREAKAAPATTNMKDLSLNWDLPVEGKVYFSAVSSGIGSKSVVANMSNFKIRDMKSGDKKLIFNLTFDMGSITAGELEKVYSSGDKFAGHYFAVADYETGIDLEAKDKNGDSKNDLGVTVRSSLVKSKSKSFVIYDGNGEPCDMRSYKTYYRYKVTITYPASYKGLCIGVGGYNDLATYHSDYRFWEGKAPFGNTSYYIKAPANSHWMKVGSM